MMDLHRTPFHDIAEDIPENSMVLGRLGIVSFLQPDGTQSVRWETDGDEFDVHEAVAALETVKFQLFHHTLGQCEHRGEL